MKVYTKDEYKILFEDITARKVVLVNSVAGQILSYYEEGVFDHTEDAGGNVAFFKFTDVFERHFPNVYRAMYLMDFDKLPLDINDEDVSFIVKWRLRIGK